MKGKTRILLVDDDPNLRKTLADILRIKGYEIFVAATGAEAIAAASENPVSLALIDLMLPDLSGLEVMSSIKAASPTTAAIILTGNASMDTAIEATRKGAYSYLLKPYDMDSLLRNVQHGVEHQRAQEEILRLASFPRLNPNPIVELDPAGDVTYLNPAAERLFPDLKDQGLSQPLLRGLREQIAVLRRRQTHREIIREVELRGTTFELHISYVAEVDLIRIQAMDISQRKIAEHKIHQLATTDSLTGIANRSEFTRILELEMKRARRYGTPMALLMYDLDFFKRVNDEFGHDIGDYVLQTVSRIVNNNIRGDDVQARWGGEEFMVLLPQTDLAAAMAAADKLREAIAEHEFSSVNTITASFGVTEMSLRDDTNKLLKRADDALYLAKQRGKNRAEAVTGAIQEASASTGGTS
jgi:diguanylate cyclase (GGDEF)-like protein